MDPEQLTETLLEAYACADNKNFVPDDTRVFDIDQSSGYVTFTAECDHVVLNYDIPLLHLLAFVYASKS